MHSELVEEHRGWAGACWMDAATVRSRQDDAEEELRGGGMEEAMRLQIAIATNGERKGLILALCVQWIWRP